jgi:hypothetical protein
MVRAAHGLFVLVACGGCRQLFGIEDTRVADDDQDPDAATTDAPIGTDDAPPNSPDATPDAPPPDARACAAMYPLVFLGHRYELGPTNENWTLAQARCVADGGYLAVPDDLAENDFVRGLNGGTLWLGVTDSASEGSWVTVQGEPIPPHFENWGDNLPNGGNAEDCVQIYTSAGGQDGEWDDGDCPNGRRALCECDP